MKSGMMRIRAFFSPATFRLITCLILFSSVIIWMVSFTSLIHLFKSVVTHAYVNGRHSKEREVAEGVCVVSFPEVEGHLHPDMR